MDVFMGTVMSFGFDFAPRNWATCNGQLIAISSNQALFSLLGTNFGGNGQTTFALPNLQGRAVIGRGLDTNGRNWGIGEIAGTENTTMLLTQLPPHTHNATTTVSLPAYSDTGNTADPNGNTFAISSGSNLYTTNAASDTALRAFQENIVVGMAGGSQPFNSVSPYQVVNYSIALYGLFPSRN